MAERQLTDLLLQRFKFCQCTRHEYDIKSGRGQLLRVSFANTVRAAGYYYERRTENKRDALAAYIPQYYGVYQCSFNGSICTISRERERDKKTRNNTRWFSLLTGPGTLFRAKLGQLFVVMTR